MKARTEGTPTYLTRMEMSTGGLEEYSDLEPAYLCSGWQ
jgi:hypothetical protein